MSVARCLLLSLLVLIAVCGYIQPALADGYGFYATGTFQFDSTSISGKVGGICSGQCSPWGDLTIFNLSFSSSVVDYEQTVSCANQECEHELSGKLGSGAFYGEIFVGYPSQFYYLSPGSIDGTFKTQFCTGKCRSYRPETELSLDFNGTWNNDWYSTGKIQLACFQKDGCSDGDGAGNLNTYAPEPSGLALLIIGIGSLGCAFRRRLS
jgi:hypothetical protein